VSRRAGAPVAALFQNRAGQPAWGVSSLKMVKMTNSILSEVKTTQKEPERERRIFTLKATQLVWLVFGILEVLIALRIGLKLIGANPGSPFVVFLYGFTGFFLLLFTGLTTTPAAGGMVLEISSVIAMFVYALLAWGLERMTWLISYRPRALLVGVTQTTTTD
jgi:hypothetical protein